MGMRRPTLLTLCFALGAGVWAFSFPGAGAEPGIDPESHKEVVVALEGQVSLLKWVGACIVTGLASAVVFLARALLTEVKVGRDALLKESHDTTEALNLLRQAVI